MRLFLLFLTLIVWAFSGAKAQTSATREPEVTVQNFHLGAETKAGIGITGAGLIIGGVGIIVSQRPDRSEGGGCSCVIGPGRDKTVGRALWAGGGVTAILGSIMMIGGAIHDLRPYHHFRFSISSAGANDVGIAYNFR